MSAETHAELRADDWVARFVVLAKRMQMATAEPPSIAELPLGSRPERPEERQKAAEELGAILLPLRESLTRLQIEHLLFDNDPDVRLAAALTLGSKNDELRLSAIKSAVRGSSMEEVLANRRRARSKPPSSPGLEEMGVDELVARFVDAGERKALADGFLDWGTNSADRRIGGQRLREMFDVYVRMKELDLLEHLRPLMDSKNPRARLGAAVACLCIDEAKAIAVLEDVSKNGGLMERGDAGLTLRELRSSS